MPVHHVCAWCLYRPEETIRSLGTGIASGCAMQMLRSQFLTKSSTHTSLLNHLSSPSVCFLRVLFSSLCLSSDILTLTCRALRGSKYPETCLSAPQPCPLLSFHSCLPPSCLPLETSSTLIPCPQTLWVVWVTGTLRSSSDITSPELTTRRSRSTRDSVWLSQSSSSVSSGSEGLG